MCGRRSRRPGGANDGDKKEEATAVVVEEGEAPGLEVLVILPGEGVWLLTQRMHCGLELLVINCLGPKDQDKPID